MDGSFPSDAIGRIIDSILNNDSSDELDNKVTSDPAGG
jgi:hypothetical protein